MSGWNSQLAELWTNNVPPSRPSPDEMVVYTKYLRQLQQKKTHPIRLLVLGSTPEFRDWGYEQHLSVSVIDQSADYYHTISRELRHKNTTEKLYISRWEDMLFENEFDLIVGDLAIGNVQADLFDLFLYRISNALTSDGIFMGKSFFWSEDLLSCTPSEIAESYKAKRYLHPYTYMNHQLGLYCLNKDKEYIDFSKMYEEVEQLWANGEIDEDTFKCFQNIGWNTEMKFL